MMQKLGCSWWKVSKFKKYMQLSELDPITGDPWFLSVIDITDEQVFFSEHTESQNRINFQTVTPDNSTDWKTRTT